MDRQDEWDHRYRGTTVVVLVIVAFLGGIFYSHRYTQTDERFAAFADGVAYGGISSACITTLEVLPEMDSEVVTRAATDLFDLSFDKSEVEDVFEEWEVSPAGYAAARVLFAIHHQMRESMRYRYDSIPLSQDDWRGLNLIGRSAGPIQNAYWAWGEGWGLPLGVEPSAWLDNLTAMCGELLIGPRLPPLSD